MIKLENVSTLQLIECIKNLKYQDKSYEHVYALLIDNNIENYQTLKEFILSKNTNDEFTLDYLKKELSLVEEKVFRANMYGRHSQIYSFNIYNESNIDEETLKITDSLNYGNILIYSSLFRNESSKSKQLRYLTIYELKHLASHLSRYRLRNGLIDKRTFGKYSIEKVIKRINFYEQQVLRQAKETSERGVNLFMINKKEKDQIVESQLEEIINYIINSNERYIWGNLTEEQKIKMTRILASPYSKTVREDKITLIDTISNYTTLNELEAGIVKNKTLSRFIVK